MYKPRGMLKYIEKNLTALFLAAVCLVIPGCAEPQPTLEESLRLVNQHLAAGRPEQAISLLESLDAKFSNRIEVLEPLGFLNAEMKNHTVAAGYFIQASRAAPTRREFLLYAAQSYKLANNPQDATNQYYLYLDTNPTDSSIWKNLGELQQESGDMTAAIKAYLESYRHQADGEIAVRLGKLFDLADNQPQAKSWLQTALQLKDGAEENAMLGLLELAIKQKDFTTAVALVKNIDENYPDRLDVSHLASMREELKKWREQQVELYRELKEQERVTHEFHERASFADIENKISASSPEAGPLEIQRIPQTMGRNTIVDRTRESALDVSVAPRTKNPQNLLAEARRHNEAGQYKLAIREYREILRIYDQSAEIWSELAHVYSSVNQPLWARLISMEAIRRDPTNLNYTLQYLDLAPQTQTPQRYFKELLQAKKKFPQSPDITLALARANNTIMDNPRLAAGLYREFLEMAADHPKRADVVVELQALSQP